MIGVIATPEEMGVAEEFFQLFKTPWEPWREGGDYDVILSSGQRPTECGATLVLVCGSSETEIDDEFGFASNGCRCGGTLSWRDLRIPIYGNLRTFGGPGERDLCTTLDSETVAMAVTAGGQRLVRIGCDLFTEVGWLLCEGQPTENAAIPTLDLHIDLLRSLILGAGIALVEVPPMPAGHEFAVCLTHDIDFVGIRRHKLDHTMWGFLYRSTVGAMLNLLRGKATVSRVLGCWKAAASLPFVYLGWVKDFWMPFEWYLEVERGLSPTYFLIPFKRRMGEKVAAPHAERRASAYDITDIPDWVDRLQAAGSEIGVHGLDAWHSVEKGRAELERVAAVAGQDELGIRMHWLLHDERTCRILEESGYSYDSTCGYNEVPGYRNGTTQIFQPLGAERLLELPMHIQDGALFYPGRMGLSEIEAWQRCESIVTDAWNRGGVLTLLWHDRSHGPERFWGDFYAKLVGHLKQKKAWFASGGQAVGWFRARRQIGFKSTRSQDGGWSVRVSALGRRVSPGMRVRTHCPGIDASARVVDREWDGESDFEVTTKSNCVPTRAAIPV